MRAFLYTIGGSVAADSSRNGLRLFYMNSWPEP